MHRTGGRGRFIAAGAAAAAGIGFVRSVRAAQFEYKLGTTNPIDDPQTSWTIRACNQIKAETNGRLQITVFPDSQLGSQSNEVSQVRLGAIQFISTSELTLAGLVPAASIVNVGFAFQNTGQVMRLLAGGLGEYIRKELAAKGMYTFNAPMESGFRHITTSTKPIHNVNDLAGLKIRVPPTPIFAGLFKTLGASPASIESNQTYVSMQTHVVDAEETNYGTIENHRFYEVQKYLSITNHIWSGYWTIANPDAWKALPPDIQAVVERNIVKHSLAELKDVRAQNGALVDKLKRQGLIFNTADTGGMRALLGPYYAFWKNELGSTAWGLLEAEVGKLA